MSDTMTPLRRLGLLGLLLAIGTFAIVATPATDWLTAAISWADYHPTLIRPVFVLGYVLATVLAIPASILTLVAGFLFGLPVGIALTSAGSTLGACSAFLIGRTFARRWIAERITTNRRFAAIDRATQYDGFMIVLLARLSPLFPFNLLNYLLSLTAVRFRDYALASWIGMLPATAVYVYVGTAAGNLHALLSGDVNTGLAGRVLLFGGLAATVLLSVLITRKARRSFEGRLKTIDDDVPSRDR